MTIYGSVTEDGSEPEVSLTVAPPDISGNIFEIQAVVDTGFTGEVTLPLERIQRLGYSYAGTVGGTLADGRETQMDYYEGWVWWHGEYREIVVVAAEGQPLIGMELLNGSRLTIDVAPGGEVLIQRL